MKQKQVTYKRIGFETEKDQVIIELITDVPNDFSNCDIYYSRSFKGTGGLLSEINISEYTKELIREFVKDKNNLYEVGFLEVGLSDGFKDCVTITCFNEIEGVFLNEN